MVFSSQSAQKILLYTFLHGKCYGTTLSKTLKKPLTPLQKSLIKLEREGILRSELEGKTRVYSFNPAYPLLTELELLLKKSFTLLPEAEKKLFYPEIPLLDNPQAILQSFWKHLASITKLTFKTTTKEPSGTSGEGKGVVTPKEKSPTTLTFYEKGTWKLAEGGELSFSNVYQWTRHQDGISLEHLRQGPTKPVFLFHLTPTSDYSLASTDSYLCKEDVYLGQIHFNQHALHLRWRIIGPKKNEVIDTYYS